MISNSPATIVHVAITTSDQKYSSARVEKCWVTPGGGSSAGAFKISDIEPAVGAGARPAIFETVAIALEWKLGFKKL